MLIFVQVTRTQAVRQLTGMGGVMCQDRGAEQGCGAAAVLAGPVVASA
jgi:hypothetical protein